MDDPKLPAYQTEEANYHLKELEKVYVDFLYFVESYCVIQDRKSGSDIPFKLWPGQLSCIDTILTAKMLIILKARQLGLTWMTAAYVLWRANFHSDELIIVISATEDLAIEFLDRVKFMLDRLPIWLKSNQAKRNTSELLFGRESKDENGATVMGGINSHIKSIASTPAAGQSKTISLLIMDESALGRYCKEIWGAAKPTLEHADGQAIIISNPSKDKPGWAWTRDIYTRSMKGLNVFKRIFLDWRCVPGRGDDFLELQKLDGLDDEDLIMQYPSTEADAISAMFGSYFGRSVEGHEDQDGTRAFLRDGKLEIDKRGNLEIWQLPYDQAHDWDQSGWENRYAIGSDVSEGLGQTASVAYVMDRLTDSIICRMLSTRTDAYEWANMIHALGKFYHNDGMPALACVEVTGPGQTTVKRLKELAHPQYTKMKATTAGKPFTKQFGWSETQQSKHELCGDLKTYLNNTESNVSCARLIEECTTFIRHDNGRLGHEDGKYDDCVMGAGCTIQAGKFLASAAKQVGQDRATNLKREEMRKDLPEYQIDEWDNVEKEIELMHVDEEEMYDY